MLSSFFKKLLMTKQLHFIEGDVAVFGINHILQPASGHLHLHQLLLEKMGERGAEVVYESGKNAALELARQLYLKFKLKGLESVGLWQNLIELNGMAKIRTVSPKEGGKVLVEATSIVAKTVLQKQGKSKGRKVDVFLAGFLAGVFSQIYNRELECSEVKCLVEGEPFCLFAVQPK